jgi:PAS domain S-box-containing protein
VNTTVAASAGSSSDFLADAPGEMALRVRQFDWGATPLGPIHQWPSSLRTTVEYMLRSPVAKVLLWGVDGVMIYNDGYADFAGTRHPSLLGSKVREGWPEVADFNDNVMRVGLAGGTLAYQDRELVLRRHGRLESGWMNLYYSPVIAEDGKPAGVMAVVFETTQSVLARRALQDEREQLRQLFEQAPTFMALMQGPEHRIVLANPGYRRLVARDQVVGRTIAEVLPDAVAQGYLRQLDEVFRTGKAYSATSARYTVAPPDGGPALERWIDFVLQPLKDVDGRVTGVFVEGADVTARAESEAAMRATEARLRELNADLERQVLERSFTRGQVWRLSPDLLGSVDRHAHLLAVNPAWSRVLGWSEEELRGKDLLALLHPDDLEMSRAAFYSIDASTPALRVPNRVRHKDGSYRWISWVAVMEGEVIYGMGRDITTEKIAEKELESAQAALRQSQKMEALGQMTGGVAHDFNNLLASITGSLELVQLRLERAGVSDLNVEPLIRVAQQSAQRGAALTQRLLAFARQQQLDPRPTDISRLVLGLEDLIRRTVGPHIAVEVACQERIGSTQIDPAQLESALLNLTINARDAMPDGGRLRLETLDEHEPAGDYVTLRVIDTGVGMSPEVLGRACDPFFTTKPLGQGTGLGLSMIQGFVHQSGGHMQLQSEIGRGTTVCLRFPRHLGDAHPESGPAAKSNEELQTPPHQRESVLVIDDEPGIREVIALVLGEEGYRVIEAADGHEGLEILKSTADIDLLITDVGLPGGLNGREVANLARAMRPDLKVLFATGYAEQSLIGKGHLDAGMLVLRKPFPLERLTAAVRGLLDGVDGG